MVSHELIESIEKLDIQEIHDKISQTKKQLEKETDFENIENLELTIEILNNRIKELKFKTWNTIERKKIKDGDYKYFVADLSGKKIGEINKDFYNPIEIGSLSEEIEDEDGNMINRIYHRFYEFTYKDVLPKYRVEFNENDQEIAVYQYDWDEDEDEDQDQDEDQEEINWESESNYTLNKGGEIVELKAIFNDNGEQIKSIIKSIDEYIPEIGFIVTLYDYVIGEYNQYSSDTIGWWAKEWSNAFGKENELQCVINFEGNYIIEPCREKIKYIAIHKLFSVGGYLTFSQIGVMQAFNIEVKKYSLYQNQIDDNVKAKRDLEKRCEYITFRDNKKNKIGLMKNGLVCCNPNYNEIQNSDKPDVFIVNQDNKLGFISADLFEGSIILKETEIKFDQLFELSQWGYLCKSNSENKIFLFHGFSEESNPLVDSFDTLNEQEVVNIINQKYSMKISILKKTSAFFLEFEPY